jgi:uncharacterized protein (DUF1499 family)
MPYNHEVEHSIRSTLSLCFGAAGFVLLPVGALGTKFGLWHHNVGMIMVVMAFLAALVPVALFIGFAWHPGYRKERRGLALGMLLGILPLGVAGYLFGSSSGAPIIHDIATDTTRPPQFMAALQQRSAEQNSLEWSEANAAEQRIAYPQLRPIETTLDPQQAFARALSSAQALGWEIIDSDSRPGFIEAVDTSFWFGFKDDIVIRIEAATNGSVIDLRSASRVGRGDLGANAARIERFIAQFSRG